MLKDFFKMIQVLLISFGIHSISSRYIATNSLIKSANVNFISLQKVAGTVYSPNGIIKYS